MTLVVEDGTGVANADSYVSLAEIDAYATAYGKTGWPGSLITADQEVHARRATKFADNKYSFPGTPKTGTQGLFFPVQELYIRGWKLTDGVPRCLKDAVCELAIISANGTDLVDSVAARAYTYRKVVMEGLEKTERYESENNENIFRSVELLLAPLLIFSSVGTGVKIIKLRRA